MKQDIKKEAIIQAAEKRFNHFTVAKTTMAEIAGDLGISKALLYYYFPDKLSLYAAVLTNVIESVQKMEDNLPAGSDPLENMINYLQARNSFIHQHYSIIEFLKTATEKAPEELKQIFSRAKVSELKNIERILEKGEKDKILHMKDTAATAELLLNCLQGLRYVMLQQDGVMVFPTKEQFNSILAKEKELVSIFVKGLR
ncbi:MAG: TetR/AcrR family transcriptional regulator [Chitinophagaceae bacterium]|nr:TetR/AcrR family transcriptional regulator [Chitinophagaceae bacterium]